ncbi:MAG TPA: N-6 DNA methylase [Roseiflexaceae bacterium]|nr:N-6 DNA methylase [Roseiflexaceae bacterium]
MRRPDAHRRAHGQFFTPAHVVSCCFALLADELSPEARLADPSCGDGAFLRGALDLGLRPDRLYGCDVDPALVAALRDGGLERVALADGLAPDSLPARAFDLVVGNPPFGIATATPAGRFHASEVRFLLRALDLARPGGAVGLVLPSGVLANERLRGLRSELLARATPLAVIALPRQTFSHTGTSALCSLVLLRAAPPPPGWRVFFAIARDQDDLPAICAAYHRRESATDGPVCFWLEQSPELARRLDAHYWDPRTRGLLERLATRHALHPLGELLDQRGGLIAGDHVRPSRGEARGPGLPYEYYQTRQFLPAGYNYAAIEHCDERAYRRLAYTGVRQHDILVSCAGVGGAGMGRVCLITHRPDRSCTGDVLIVRAQQPDPLFLFLFLRSAAGRAQLLRLQNGVGTANLSADELLQVLVPLPPAADQRAVAARYALVAAAHDQAMRALLDNDGDAYRSARAAAERLLEAETAALEALLGAN